VDGDSGYRRDTPDWIEYVCAEDNHQVAIGNENCVVTDDGYLKPTRPNQPAPICGTFRERADKGEPRKDASDIPLDDYGHGRTVMIDRARSAHSWRWRLSRPPARRRPISRNIRTGPANCEVPGQGNQWDQTKPFRHPPAPLTPEYQKIYAANLQDQKEDGQGLSNRLLHSWHAAHDDRRVPLRIRRHAEHHHFISDYNFPRRIYTDGRDWPKERERTSPAIRSANGSTPTATASSTRWRPRPVTSRDRASTKAAEFHCTKTVQR
jgi:hypothetical protein